MLEPASNRSILFRMLANLKGACLKVGEGLRALRALERMLVLAPAHPGLLRDRGLLLFELEPLRRGDAKIWSCTRSWRPGERRRSGRAWP